MTLRQQFSLLTSALVLALMTGSLLLTVNNGRAFFQQQLDARAYDAATALALSMSSVADADEVSLQRQMDVLFDRGFFQRIELRMVSGRVFQRQADAALDHSAPAWFRRWLALTTEPAEADVVAGWSRLGKVTVVSHTDFAYRDLWAMVRQETQWFVAVSILALLALQGLLSWMLRPLARVEQQAQALCERRWQLQSDVPKTRELGSMVRAMNRTVSTLKRIFSEQSALAERLREEAFHDAVTGLLNRRGFDQRLEHLLSSGEGYRGVLMLLQLRDFARFNQQQGRQHGDELLQSVARALAQWLPSEALCGRRTGADFAVFLPGSDQQSAHQQLTHCFEHLASGILNDRQNQVFHLGGVWLEGERGQLSQALSAADEALRHCQRNAQSDCYLDSGSVIQAASQPRSAGQWRQQLQQALEQRDIELLYLPVFTHPGAEQPLQLEVISRVKCGDDWLSGARFWPLAEQHQLASGFDLLIVEAVLKAMQQGDGLPCCINLSPSTICDEAACQRLLQQLACVPELCPLIAFEVPEFAIAHIELRLQQLATQLAELGVQLGVDQVGSGRQAFSYLQRLPLSYVRLAGHLNRNCHAAADQRFYLQSMVQIAHSQALSVFAEGLEHEADVTVVREAGVDGLSGYFFSEPWQAPV
jgi:diguanylate cyclase (GGDEF)-like protein